MNNHCLKTAFSLIVGLSLVLPVFAGDEYTIDQAHSSVSFTVRHMVVSKVRGSFAELEGVIKYLPEDPTSSSVQVTIKPESINTGDEKRDAHLRNPDFFDVEKYPEMTFASSNVGTSGDGFVLTGVLTMHGVSREVEIPFKVNGPIQDPWGNTRMGVEAEPITLDRKDFGLTYNRALEGGGLVVGDEITVEIALEAVRRAPEPAD
jgi:polyisoprenoid-binding protein YceI